MKDKIREAVVDLVKWAVGLALLLVAFYLFGTIRAHHALVNAFTEVLEAQRAQMEQQGSPPTMPK